MNQDTLEIIVSFIRNVADIFSIRQVSRDLREIMNDILRSRKSFYGIHGYVNYTKLIELCPNIQDFGFLRSTTIICMNTISKCDLLNKKYFALDLNPIKYTLRAFKEMSSVHTVIELTVRITDMVDQNHMFKSICEGHWMYMKTCNVMSGAKIENNLELSRLKAPQLLRFHLGCYGKHQNNALLKLIELVPTHVQMLALVRETARESPIKDAIFDMIITERLKHYHQLQNLNLHNVLINRAYHINDIIKHTHVESFYTNSINLDTCVNLLTSNTSLSCMSAYTKQSIKTCNILNIMFLPRLYLTPSRMMKQNVSIN